MAAHPGTTGAAVARALALHYNTARYHLGLLAEFGALRERKTRDGVRYFGNHGRYTAAEEATLSAAARPENLAFLRLVARSPGLTQKRAAIALGLAQSTVSERVSRLVTAGLLSREGGALRLTAEGSRALAAGAGVSGSGGVTARADARAR